MALFQGFNSRHREVLASSDLLPTWLKPLPRFLRRGSRRYWWSLRSMPVSGWHVQQLLKFAAAASLPGSRFCMLDSDVAFFRPYDLNRYRKPNRVPVYFAQGTLSADAPLHATWVRTSHSLLGLVPPAFPADDFIGHVIFWDQETVKALIRRIEQVTGCEWVEALCRTRDFSEYMLYGYFQRSDGQARAMHCETSWMPCLSYWEPRPLDMTGIRRLIGQARDGQVAFSAASLSGTPVELLRGVLAELAAAPSDDGGERAAGGGLDSESPSSSMAIDFTCL
jgi:hypothetical protein